MLSDIFLLHCFNFNFVHIRFCAVQSFLSLLPWGSWQKKLILMLICHPGFFLVMANDFDGQIDYLEQFGSSSVSTCFMTNQWQAQDLKQIKIVKTSVNSSKNLHWGNSPCTLNLTPFWERAQRSLQARLLTLRSLVLLTLLHGMTHFCFHSLWLLPSVHVRAEFVLLWTFCTTKWAQVFIFIFFFFSNSDLRLHRQRN